MKAKIKISGKEVLVEDIKRVSWLGKYFGLMFRKNSQALLFDFSKPCRRGIHSFFCNPFIAVWFLGGKVQEYKVIDSWHWYIAPEKEFDKLLEIPLTERYMRLLELFVDKLEE